VNKNLTTQLKSHNNVGRVVGIANTEVGGRSCYRMSNCSGIIL